MTHLAFQSPHGPSCRWGTVFASKRCFKALRKALLLVETQREEKVTSDQFAGAKLRLCMQRPRSLPPYALRKLRISGSYIHKPFQ